MGLRIKGEKEPGCLQLHLFLQLLPLQLKAENSFEDYLLFQKPFVLADYVSKHTSCDSQPTWLGLNLSHC